METIYKVVDRGMIGTDGHVICFVKSEREAQKIAKGKGPMGMSDGAIYKYVLYDSLEDYRKNSPEAIRKRALDKLTEEEIEALGIDP